MSIRVVHYINQFFANIGGEEKADIKPELRVGEVIGPGMAFKAQFKDEAEIVATIICGDSYFGENTKEATATIMEMIKSQKPDLFIAGPAFNAGRYGFACGNTAFIKRHPFRSGRESQGSRRIGRNSHIVGIGPAIPGLPHGFDRPVV
jgi:glycine/betaine/sarcosine/D-proline reductase family selenoprotein B